VFTLSHKAVAGKCASKILTKVVMKFWSERGEEKKRISPPALNRTPVVLRD